MTQAATLTSLASFLSTFRDSGIVTGPAFDNALTKLPTEATDGPQAAVAFIELGVLTRFQADRLLLGRADGFILGQYLILEPIGKGLHSKIYKARHRTMNRLVAVKVIEPKVANTAEKRDTIQHQARAWATLVHPHVVTMLDINQVNDRLYMVMEFIEGITLDATVKAVKKRSGLPFPRACEYARQLALGLAHTHERGQTHGCLNPSNVLIGRPGGKGQHDRLTAKLLNVCLQSLASIQEPTDTKYFIAPERIADSSAPATPAADYYSLGAILYFLLTGRPPVPIHKHNLVLDPLPIENLRPDVPGPVLDVVKRLMTLEPEYRPTSGQDIADRLEPFAEQVDTHADYSVVFAQEHQPHLESPPPGLQNVQIAPSQQLDSETWTDPWSDLDEGLVQTDTMARLNTPVVIPKLPGNRATGLNPSRKYRTSETPQSGSSFIAIVVVGVVLVSVLAIGLVIKFATK